MTTQTRTWIETMLERLLGRWRIPVIACIAAGTVVFATEAVKVGIEHDNTSLVAEDSTEIARYEEFQQAFGNDEDLIIALVHPDPLSTAGLGAIDEISRDLAALDGVRQVWSLTTAEVVAPGRYGAEPTPLVERPFDTPGAGVRAAEALDRNPEIAAWLISPDHTTAGFVVEIENRPADGQYRHRVIDAIRALGRGRSSAAGSLHLTGIPVQKHDVSAAIARDQRVLLPLAVLILALTLWSFYRTIDGIVIPLGVAGVTVVWTSGLYGWTGHAWNAITSLLPATLLVVALAATVHVYEAWRNSAGIGPPDRRRAVGAVAAVAVPVALCALTTVEGFLSLTANEVPAVKQFGAFAAFGVGVALIVGLIGVPCLLGSVSLRPRGETALHRYVRTLSFRAAVVATVRPRAVVVVFSAVTVVALAGLLEIRSDTDLVGFLRKDAQLRIDTDLIDGKLGGALPIDFIVRRRDRAPIVTPGMFDRMHALETAVRAQAGVVATGSAVALVAAVQRAETRGAGPYLPSDLGTFSDAIALLDESGNALWRRFVAPDRRALRLTVRMGVVGSSQSLALVRAVEHEAALHLGEDVEVLPTGALYHVARDSDRLVLAQVRSFAIAIFCVVATIGLLFRSLAWTALALVPNLMPIVWTGGLMGVFGIELSTGTAMIASAVLGLVVDDTIHYLSAYRQLYRGDAVAAAREAANTIGGPVGVAAVGLVLGFWVGAFGSFLPTVYFSVLTGVTMIVGVLCDVLLLPALLVVIDRNRKSESAGA